MKKAPPPYIVGLDLGGTAIKAAAFAFDGECETSYTVPTGDGEFIDGKPAWAVRIRRAVSDFTHRLGGPARAIGLSAPGLAAADRRSIASLPNRLAGIEGFDWTAWLGRPVFVLNDAHAALLGEVWRGAARARRNVVLLTLGTGVGGAAMVDGCLLRGHLGRAGHLGHVALDCFSEESTIFGMPGGLETFLGNYNVPLRSGGRFADTRSLLEAVAAGDEGAVAVWHRSLRALGCAVGSFINIFDPEIVVIGGGIADAGPLLWLPLQRILDEVEWRPFDSGVPIVTAELGNWAGASGAAHEALTNAS